MNIKLPTTKINPNFKNSVPAAQSTLSLRCSTSVNTLRCQSYETRNHTLWEKTENCLMLNVVVHKHVAATELFNARRVGTVSNVDKTRQWKMRDGKSLRN